MPKFPSSFSFGYATDRCLVRPVRGVVALLLRFVRGLRLASPSLLAFLLFRVQISRVLRRVRLSCCASVPMFPFSVPLGSQRSRASRSGSSGSAAALRSGSALGLALYACNPLVFSLGP